MAHTYLDNELYGSMAVQPYDHTLNSTALRSDVQTFLHDKPHNFAFTSTLLCTNVLEESKSNMQSY